MGLKATRKILSVILCVVMAACTFFSAVCIVTSQTYGKQDFYVKNWCTDELAQRCEEQLDSKLEALSYKSGIPLDVFMAAKRDNDVKSIISDAVSGLYNDYDSSLYDEKRVEYFYSLCEMYLKANNYNYKQSDIMNVAEEAAWIYCDSLGIQNAQTIRSFTEKSASQSNSYSAVFLMLVLFSFAIIMFLHREIYIGLTYVGAAIAGAGLGQMLMAICAVLFGVANDFGIKPSAYEAVMENLHRVYMLDNGLLGACLLVLGIAILALSFVRIKIKKERKERGYYNVPGKF